MCYLKKMDHYRHKYYKDQMCFIKTKGNITGQAPMKLKRKVSRIISVINGSKHKWPEHTTLFKMTRLPAALSSVSSLAICQYPHAKCCNLWNFHLWPPPDKQLGIKTRHFYHLMTITLQANNIKKNRVFEMICYD